MNVFVSIVFSYPIYHALHKLLSIFLQLNLYRFQPIFFPYLPGCPYPVLFNYIANYNAMKISWESNSWPGSSIVPSNITHITWMSHVPSPHAPPTHTTQPQSSITQFYKDGKPSKTRGRWIWRTIYSILSIVTSTLFTLLTIQFSGFLAVGTESGVLGVTVTDTADLSTLEELDISRRYNYNLRGHHSK